MIKKAKWNIFCGALEIIREKEWENINEHISYRWCWEIKTISSWFVELPCFNKLQHFTTFTPSRKLTKQGYIRSELRPLDFLQVGPYRLKCPPIFHTVFASLYGFVAFADWYFCTLQNARLDMATFSCCYKRGLPGSPYVQCHFKGESGKYSVTRKFSAHSNCAWWYNVTCTISKDNMRCPLSVCHIKFFVPVEVRNCSYVGNWRPRCWRKAVRNPI